MFENGQWVPSWELPKMANDDSLCVRCAQMFWAEFYGDEDMFVCRKRTGIHGPMKRCKDFISMEENDRRMTDAIINGKSYKLP